MKSLLTTFGGLTETIDCWFESIAKDILYDYESEIA